jgi:site-specific recombinase XerD
VAKHDSNTIIKFADNTTVVGLINENDETAYREVLRDLAVWCQDNNLSPNVSKTKKLIVVYRKGRAEQAPTNNNRAVVERVESFKFLGVHITNKLSWSKHTKIVVKRARQKPFPSQEIWQVSQIRIRYCV